jgi:hypothetical protein
MHNLSVEAIGTSQRHPLRLAGIVAASAVFAICLAAAVLYLWLRTYAPLSAFGAGSFAPGPGIAADIEPVTGSGGKPVFIPNYRRGHPFDTAFTVHNTGRFAVTVKGLATVAKQPVAPSALLATDSPTASADPRHLHTFRQLRLGPGDSVILVVRWQLDCGTGAGEAYADRVPLRYRYLSIFRRTEAVRLPFAVTLRCPG